MSHCELVAEKTRKTEYCKLKENIDSGTKLNSVKFWYNHLWNVNYTSVIAHNDRS